MKTRCCHSKHYRKGIEESVEQENISPVICLNRRCKNYLGSTELFSNRILNNFTGGLLFGFMLCFCQSDYSSVTKNCSLSSYSQPLVECTEDVLKAEITSCNLICPQAVMAQVLIESGHMTSGLFKKTNNLLGMRYPFRRETKATGLYLPDEDIIVKGTQRELMKYSKNNNYAVYDSWQDCVADYKFWQDQNFKVNDRYLSFLKTYAQDSSYIAKIRKMTK